MTSVTEAGAGKILDFLHDPPVQGELLADKLAQGFLPPEKALQYAVQIGAILSRAHARGLAQGSLSPYAVAITAAGACVLKPPPSPDSRAVPYRSPEQARGEAAAGEAIFSRSAACFMSWQAGAAQCPMKPSSRPWNASA